MISLASIAQSLIPAAVTRLVPVVYQKFMRRRRIELVLRGTALQQPAISAALADFEITIGSEGNLTEGLDKFLKEFQSSGLIVALAEEACRKKRTNDTKESFIQLYSTICQSPSVSPNDLYEKIATSFEVSFELLANDPTMSLLLNAVADSIEQRLHRIEAATMRFTPPQTEQASYPRISETLQKISRALMTSYRDLWIETNKGSKAVSVEKIFIPSKLKSRKESELYRQVVSLELPEAQSRGTRHAPRGLYQSLDQSLTYSDFKAGFRRVVVLGDPGGGKSTLCQFLCHQFARQYMLRLQHPEKREEFDPQSLKLPLRVVLRSFENARLKSPQLGIFDYIVNEIRSTVSTVSVSEIEECLRFTLTYGYAILAFDGLDEILDTGTRREFVRAVVTFGEEFPHCPVCVTSRVVGYEYAPLPEDFEELILEKFDTGEIRAYVIKFLRVVSNLDAHAAETQATRFMEQTAGNAADLRQNPLMLGLMSYLFAIKGDVPGNRPEIYRECATLMFEKWDQNRLIRADIPSGFYMLHLFSQIAAEMYGDPSLEDGVSERWIRDKNFSYFATVFEDKARAFEAAKKVTDFVKGRSWVMSEFGPDVYRFTHRTFMEYFFACHLDEENETVDELISALRPKIIRSEWDVISRLALQIKTYRNQRRTTQAATLLGQYVSDRLEPLAIRTQLGFFFASALEFLFLAEIELKEALNCLFNLSLELAEQDESEDALRLLVSASNCVFDRREYTHNRLSELLSDHIFDVTEKSGGFCARALSARWDSWIFGVRYDIELPISIRQLAYDRLRPRLTRVASKDAFFAGLSFEWYNDGFDELFSLHKFAMFTSDIRPWRSHTAALEALCVLPLFAAGYPFRTGPHPNVSDPVSFAKDTLRTIGNLIDDDNEIPTITSGPPEVGPFVSAEVWSDIITRGKFDPATLRGALICFLLSERLATSRRHGLARDSRTQRADPHNDSIGKFLVAATKAVSRFNPDEREKFSEWLRTDRWVTSVDPAQAAISF